MIKERYDFKIDSMSNHIERMGDRKRNNNVSEYKIIQNLCLIFISENYYMVREVSPEYLFCFIFLKIWVNNSNYLSSSALTETICLQNLEIPFL